MPRRAVKVQGAPNKTRWTLAQSEQSLLKEDRKALTLITTMQTSGPYYDQQETPLPRYESFDGSQYSVPALDRANSGAWMPPRGTNGHFEDFEYNTPLEERASHQISLNTRMRSHNQDVVGHHLLYETAMLDSRAFEMLDIAEVDALKKEHARLEARITAANRKLTLENKVKGAAQNLQRLYSPSTKGRPDTPQSPGESGKKVRGSLLGHRGRADSNGSGNGQPLHQAEDELAVSVKKVDDLHDTIKNLLERRQLVERKLLRHTAAVLVEQSTRASQQRDIGDAARSNSHAPQRLTRDAVSGIYAPDEFDGIRDILSGALPNQGRGQKSADVQKMEEEHAHQMATVQSRLEQLNEQLRQVIDDAHRTRGLSYEPEAEVIDFDNAPSVRIGHRLDLLQIKVQLLGREQQEVQAHYARVQEGAHMTQTAVEEQLETINQRLHNTLLLGAGMEDMESLRKPPTATGHGYQQQLQYLGESLERVEGLLQQHATELDEAREAASGASRGVEEARGKAAAHTKKVDEYEATLGGLWQILQSDATTRRPSLVDGSEERHSNSSTASLKEDFSLQAFSAHVQHLFDRTQSAREQHDILRRQVQQQRELNGKSDAEKDQQITELQGRHDQLATDHGVVQEELMRVMAQHAQAESKASQSTLELQNSMNEYEDLKRTIDARQQEREEMVRQLRTHQETAASLQQRVEELETQVAEMTDNVRLANVETAAKATEAEKKHREVLEQLAAATSAHGELEQRHAEVQRDIGSELTSAVSAREAAEQRHADLQRDMDAQLTSVTSAKETVEQRHGEMQEEMETLKSELVRLSTELTMARAELDGAYGSRAERAKEAQTADVAGLSERNKQVSDELQKLQAEHEGLRGLHDTLTGEHEELKGTHEATLAQVEGLKTQAGSSERTKNLEAELTEMTDAFQELTRESVELEKERHQLEDLIDGLRDRCETLEGQLGDERVRSLGNDPSPSTSAANSRPTSNGVRETTSTMILRQEFKKMMRESRAEGIKLLRAEQEHRRHLESEVRRLRQANGPLAKALPNGIGSISAASTPPALPAT
ncbi:hypothetical protein BAUCODRAFT_23136 [Baudoinia panamericana UAMH 10762]|uniref:Uncharacterized protein n=1 Tax=Baudoinia panamericana (strain UAMH 10762) TaxID=717646 RepID=M2NGB1_BAUPA|nr:uncharacterized protein BAUCODRAFT_23136 [Baudoinia panamericana UAMH 10762]EMC98344.1 hypothetical protein BAUCODRAFT_23136 [Baudoinia panamericana UAMH 10762]